MVFDRAVLKDGTAVPINATVHALAAAESSASMGMSDGNAGLAGGVAGGAPGAIGGDAGRTGAIANGTVSGSQSRETASSESAPPAREPVDRR